MPAVRIVHAFSSTHPLTLLSLHTTVTDALNVDPLQGPMYVLLQVEAHAFWWIQWLQLRCGGACEAWLLPVVKPAVLRLLLQHAITTVPQGAGSVRRQAEAQRICRLPASGLPKFRFLQTDEQWQQYCAQQGARVEAAAAALEERGEGREAYKLRLGWSGEPESGCLDQQLQLVLAPCPGQAG